MRYASVCDGIGAAHVAWQPLGWECAWTSEIEPFPAAVVDHHWKFNNLGDMTAITEEMLKDAGNIQLLVGGTPCQSFSVAGLRGGLADPRGNLALRFVQLVGVLRPSWVVWENVPGVLSSGGGRDFGTFLGALAELGYGFAYRVLDAQWFGVAQRRRRVFVVAHAGNWRRAAAVLFERESLCGNPPTRGATGQGTSVAASIRTKTGRSDDPGDGCDNLVAFHPTQDPISSTDGSTHAMGCGSKGGCCTQAVAVAQGFTYSGYSNQPAWMTGDRTDCLPASGHSDGSHQGVGVIAFKPGQGDTRATTVVAFTQNCRDEVRQINGDGQIAGALAADSGSHQTNYVAYAIDGGNQAASEEVHHSLRTGRDSGDAVAFKPSHHTRGKDGAPSNVTAPLSADADRGDQDTVVASCEVSSSLRANPGSGWRSNGTPVEGVVISPMAVRRLTPKECERLQGFPDGYTAVTYRGKPASDGPRYRALGNSMAVPVMAWMGQRIQMVEEAADGR